MFIISQCFRIDVWRISWIHESCSATYWGLKAVSGSKRCMYVDRICKNLESMPKCFKNNLNSVFQSWLANFILAFTKFTPNNDLCEFVKKTCLLCQWLCIFIWFIILMCRQFMPELTAFRKQNLKLTDRQNIHLTNKWINSQKCEKKISLISSHSLVNHLVHDKNSKSKTD